MTHIKEALLGMLPKKGWLMDRSGDSIIVRLEQASREPATPVEQLAVSMLTSTGAMPLHTLTERVASELYRQELVKGAQVLDIGLFGSRLFKDEVVREIESADGILWKIKQQRKSL